MSTQFPELFYDDAEGLYKWQKGVRTAITKDFNTSEFACPCKNAACDTQIISAILIANLQSLRNDVGIPIGVNSAYRCSLYQAELKLRGYETAVGISQHELGKAADLRCSDLLSLVSKAERYFKAIGIAKSFIHVDERSDKIRRWRYTSS